MFLCPLFSQWFYISLNVQESLDREYQRQRITGRTLDYLHTGLHILEENAVYVSVSFLVFSVVNLALDFFLLVGSCCKIRLLMLPWLLVSMLELVLLGGPLVLVTDILVLHLLSVQGHLLPCLLLTNIPALLTILLMSAWCLVLAAYVSLGPAQVDQQAEGRQGGLEVECEVRSRARHSQYTQFYRQRHRHARPHQPSEVNIYPTLPPLSSMAG